MTTDGAITNEYAVDGGSAGPLALVAAPDEPVRRGDERERAGAAAVDRVLVRDRAVGGHPRDLVRVALGEPERAVEAGDDRAGQAVGGRER